MRVVGVIWHNEPTIPHTLTHSLTHIAHKYLIVYGGIRRELNARPNREHRTVRALRRCCVVLRYRCMFMLTLFSQRHASASSRALSFHAINSCALSVCRPYKTKLRECSNVIYGRGSYTWFLHKTAVTLKKTHTNTFQDWIFFKPIVHR